MGVPHGAPSSHCIGGGRGAGPRRLQPQAGARFVENGCSGTVTLLEHIRRFLAVGPSNVVRRNRVKGYVK